MPRFLRTAARPLAALLLCAAPAACGAFQQVPAPGYPRMAVEVQEVLAEVDPQTALARRARLDRMGGALDEILVRLIGDPEVDGRVRGNAAVLLAERNPPLAVLVLRRVALTSGNAELRAGAVAGLHRLSFTRPEAANGVRASLGDPSELVRLTALQLLDVDDARLVRQLLADEDDRQVRLIAGQLLMLFEARGAPLAPDAKGDLRTAGPDSAPRIVFHPLVSDTASRTAVGALWVEEPGRELVPLAPEVEVVANVVPAFFEPRGTAVVFETQREVRLRDLRTGATRVVGRGVAPRPIPFTDRFIYLEEIPGERRQVEDGTLMEYLVVLCAFGDARKEPLGILRAIARADRWGNASPVRTMVVAEHPSGFFLRGPGISPFLLPSPFEGGGPPAVRP
jgi:hypothetical protein